jgi:type IV secretion system protein VirB11
MGYRLADVLETPFPELLPPSSVVPFLSPNQPGELP